MTLTFEHDIDYVKMNQLAKYLGQRSFSLKVIARTHRHTHSWTNCSTWTTKVVGKIDYLISGFFSALGILDDNALHKLDIFAARVDPLCHV